VALALVCLAALLWRGGAALGILGGKDVVLDRVQHTGQLRVGMDASYPPFEWVDEEGAFRGYDVDLATALAERLGAAPQFVNVHFDGLYDALLADKFDVIISALPYDRTMTRDLLYSQSYFDAGLVLLGQQGGTAIDTLEQLDGMTVAVELGSAGHQQARLMMRDRGLALTILTLRELDAVPLAVLSGEADVAICDRVTALQFLGRYQGLAIVGPMLTSDPYVIAASPRAGQFLALVNEALAAWRADGALAALENRWLESPPVD
jgi:polar amino acid transport system substrate-binding protein